MLMAQPRDARDRRARGAAEVREGAKGGGEGAEQSSEKRRAVYRRVGGSGAGGRGLGVTPRRRRASQWAAGPTAISRSSGEAARAGPAPAFDPRPRVQLAPGRQ